MVRRGKKHIPAKTTRPGLWPSLKLQEVGAGVYICPRMAESLAAAYRRDHFGKASWIRLLCASLKGGTEELGQSIAFPYGRHFAPERDCCSWVIPNLADSSNPLRSA